MVSRTRVVVGGRCRNPVLTSSQDEMDKNTYRVRADGPSSSSGICTIRRGEDRSRRRSDMGKLCPRSLRGRRLVAPRIIGHGHHHVVWCSRMPATARREEKARWHSGGGQRPSAVENAKHLCEIDAAGVYTHFLDGCYIGTTVSPLVLATLTLVRRSSAQPSRGTTVRTLEWAMSAGEQEPVGTTAM